MHARVALGSMVLSCLAGPIHSEGPYPDRWVWVFGWNLVRDAQVEDVRAVLEDATASGFNGVVLSAGLDTLCKKSPDYLQRLEAIEADCERLKLELVPAVFSVGYGGAALAHDRHLAEGVGVESAPFEVRGREARLVSAPDVVIRNGGFEESQGHRLQGFRFHDQPGEISFVDTEIVHGGEASLRLESFTRNPHGHGRVMQEIQVIPRRAYRMSVWVKTDGLEPSGAFRLLVLAGEGDLAPRSFDIPSTTDWRKVTMIFNSLSFDAVRVYAGLWGGKAGKVWLDDWSVEEVGPINVLERPGTPVTVTSEDGSVAYVEGKDYAPLRDPDFNFYSVDREAPALKLLEGGAIQDGQVLKVSWYHPMVVHSSQVTVCMGEPALYEIWDHEARLIAERLRPKRYLLNMDEIRMGGTCQACRGTPMAELLGRCITKQVEILRRHSPGAEISIWSDMLDPNHNARDRYYLVEGDYTGSWNHVPKDLVIAVWGGAPREKSLRFFEKEGFRTRVACYYDADGLDDVDAWLRIAGPLPGVRGLMYTTWQRKYELLSEFGAKLSDR